MSHNTAQAFLFQGLEKFHLNLSIENDQVEGKLQRIVHPE